MLSVPKPHPANARRHDGAAPPSTRPGLHFRENRIQIWRRSRVMSDLGTIQPEVVARQPPNANTGTAGQLVALYHSMTSECIFAATHPRPAVRIALKLPTGVTAARDAARPALLVDRPWSQRLGLDCRLAECLRAVDTGNPDDVDMDTRRILGALKSWRRLIAAHRLVERRCSRRRPVRHWPDRCRRSRLA